VAVVALSLFGRRIHAIWARQTAARQMNAWAISTAQQRLAWADPDDGNVELMKAVCHRRLGQMNRWRKALESAERNGARATGIQHENELGLIRSGQFPDGVEGRLFDLVEAALSPHDVAEAFVYGYLDRGKQDKARAFVEGWEANYPNAPHVAYLWGLYWQSQGECDRAVTHFEHTLAVQPGHEPARMAIAKQLEARYHLDEALDAYIELVTRFPTSESGRLGLSRVLRRLGRIDDARAVMEPLTADSEPVLDVVGEMRWIEFEAGAYEQAERWLKEADVDRVNEESSLSAAATVFAFAGDPIRAESLFRRRDAIISASTRMYDLGERLVIDPEDKQAAADLRRLSTGPISTSDDGIASLTKRTTEDGQIEKPARSGSELFARYCSACHGSGGDGNGRAARHLFPRPRDFRTDRFRLVSTRNGVPTQHDLEAVIERGMPGTSMRSYEKLSEDQRKLLAQEVIRQHREGIRDQFIDMLRREGEEADEAEVREVVENCTNPGEVIKPPKIGPPDSQSIARGKRMYIELGCNKCHGDDGIGATEMLLFDDKRLAARPRDLVHEPFRGGSEPKSIYLRIAVGMPGSPHPAARNLAQQQLIDVVQYCRSLSQDPKRLLTNHQQATLCTSRAYRAALRESGKVE